MTDGPDTETVAFCDEAKEYVLAVEGARLESHGLA